MPSKYPHAHFHTGEELYEWLTEHQREGESLSQTARRLLTDQMHRTTPEPPYCPTTKENKNGTLRHHPNRDETDDHQHL